MEKSNFDLLLEKYMKDQVTEDEKVKIEAWLDSEKTKNKKDFAWAKEDEEELFRKITKNIDNVEEIISFNPKRERTPSSKNSQWLAIAAALLLLVTVSVFIWSVTRDQSSSQQPIVVNDIEKIILNDGTIVWLKKKSKLIYAENTENNERRAELTGEGLFEVAKDANRPFIIDCGEIKVRVIGTSFSLKTDNKTIELKVLTGKVNLSSSSNTKGFDIEPNNKVVYAGKQTFDTKPLEESEVTTITSHTEYNMEFSNATLDEIFRRIEKKFLVKIQVENEAILKCKMRGDFTDHSLESTLEMIAEVLNLKNTISGSLVTVSGNGCK